MSRNTYALKFLGDVTSATRNIAAEIVAHLDEHDLDLPDYPPPYDGPVMHGKANGNEHGTGRALDVMVNDRTEVGDAVVDFVWDNRARYDLTHIIWRQRIISTKIAPGKWRAMPDRNGVTANHMDHPHLFFGPLALTSSGGAQTVPAEAEPAGATQAPPFPLARGSYFGPKTGPVTSVSGYYSHRSHLRRWQQRMKDRGWAITPDGLYGPKTRTITKMFQREKRLAVDGLIGPDTWAAAWEAPIT